MNNTDSDDYKKLNETLTSMYGPDYEKSLNDTLTKYLGPDY